MLSKTFRIDDVSANTNIDKLIEMIRIIKSVCIDNNILIALSPFVFQRGDERAFPPVFTAMSDVKIFLKPNTITNIQEIKRRIAIEEFTNITYANHGLVHADHRLLSKGAQEMSIVTGASICNSDRFVPPYNKYDKNTIKICKKHSINLIKFEDGWKHLKVEQFDPHISNNLYYFHTFDFTIDELKAKLKI